MSNIWFTADTHFGHSNIIRFYRLNKLKRNVLFHLIKFFWRFGAFRDAFEDVLDYRLRRSTR